MVGLVSEHDLTQAMVSGLSEERAGIEESFLRTLIDTIPDLVWLKAADGAYLACNAKFEKFFGAKAADIIGKTDYDFMSKELADFFRGYDIRAMEAGKPCVNEEWISYANDGHRELVETVKTPMYGRNGKIIGVLGVARDITKRESVQQAVRQREQEFHTLADNLPDNIIRYDRDCRVRYLNPAMALSIAPELLPIVGKLPYESDPSSGQLRGLQQLVEQVMNTGQRAELEFEIPHPDGGLHWHHVIFVPECDENGQVVGALGIGRDITTTKRAEEALRQSLELSEGVINAVPDLLFELDREGRYINIWAHEVTLLAAQKELLLGRMVNEMLPPAAAEVVMSAIAEAELKGTSSGQVISLDLPEGKRWFELSTAAKSLRKDDRVQHFIMLSRDISRRQEAEQALRDSREQLRQNEELLRTLIEAIPDAIQYKDGKGRWLESNAAARAAFGLGEAISRNRSDQELSGMVDPQFSAALLRCHHTDEEAWQIGRVSRVEEIVPIPGGEKAVFDVIKVPLFHDDGSRKGLVIVGRDVTGLKRAEEALQVTASVFDTTQDAILITDADNNIIDVNPAFTRITGYGREEVLGLNPRILSSGRHDKAFYAGMWQTLNEQHAWRGEIWNRRKDGEFFAELLSISAIVGDEGRVQRYVGVFSDITYFKEHEEELSHVANYDALTGIPNRRLLADRLRQATAVAQRNGKTLAICYLDLDGFKEVNDRFGHDKGDLLLVDITRRLQEVLRAGDTLARLGGDEFVVLFNGLAQEGECFPILDRVMAAAAKPMSLAGNMVAVSASIGVTFYPADNVDGDTLLRHADQAMYVAKQAGKNRFHVYDPVHDQRVRLRNDARRRISQGLDAGEFELYYQPKLELASGQIMGVEALIRWNHPEQGLLAPMEFLPAIENSELDIRLGNWVIGQALAQLFAWEREGLQLQVSINISAHHLQSPGFADALREMLAGFPALRPGALQIEVLETAALEDITQSSQVIEACREMGISFALDDFGTGYSSLVYLSRLSADTLKIDQSFVQGMGENDGDKAIVQGVIALAQTFGRHTVAEGLEDAALTGRLHEMGCGYVQGYSVAQPMPAGEFREWFKRRG